MARYKFSESGPETLDQYELELADNGTFNWSYSSSDPAGGAGGGWAEGTWKKSGDAITFTITKTKDEFTRLPTTATMRDNQVEVTGIGTFK